MCQPPSPSRPTMSHLTAHKQNAKCGQCMTTNQPSRRQSQDHSLYGMSCRRHHLSLERSLHHQPYIVQITSNHQTFPAQPQLCASLMSRDILQALVREIGKNKFVICLGNVSRDVLDFWDFKTFVWRNVTMKYLSKSASPCLPGASRLRG